MLLHDLQEYSLHTRLCVCNWFNFLLGSVRGIHHLLIDKYTVLRRSSSQELLISDIYTKQWQGSDRVFQTTALALSPLLTLRGFRQLLITAAFTRVSTAWQTPTEWDQEIHQKKPPSSKTGQQLTSRKHYRAMPSSSRFLQPPTLVDQVSDTCIHNIECTHNIHNISDTCIHNIHSWHLFVT